MMRCMLRVFMHSWVVACSFAKCVTMHLHCGVACAQGAYAYDVDGNKYIDYVGTWGPAICGHANPEAISLALSLTSASLTFSAALRVYFRFSLFFLSHPLLVRGMPSLATAPPLDTVERGDGGGERGVKASANTARKLTLTCLSGSTGDRSAD